MTAKLTQEEFNKKVSDLFPEYGLDRAVYINRRTPVEIFVPGLGYVFASTGNLLSGSRIKGDPLGGSGGKIKTTEEFISDCLKTNHGINFTYEKTIYTGVFNKCVVTCKKHGDIEIIPTYFLRNDIGCKFCIEELVDTFRRDITELEKECKAAHTKSGKLEYSYDFSKYENNKSLIQVTCPEHGEFSVSVNNILRKGSGCPTCARKRSIAENEVRDFVEDLGFSIIQTYKLLSCRHIDIYVPELKIGIEYNGLIWHSEEYRGKNYHYSKFLDAQAEGIRLIQVFEDEWLFDKETTKNKLMWALEDTERFQTEDVVEIDLRWEDPSRYSRLGYIHEGFIEPKGFEFERKRRVEGGKEGVVYDAGYYRMRRSHKMI